MPVDNRISPDHTPESIVLYDDYVPGITAGVFRLVAQQSVQYAEPKTGTERQHHYYQDRRFIVQGLRFHIPPEDVHATFPPAAGRGDYQNFLPHVVLNKRALPWDRTVWATDAEHEPQPWLALLTLSLSELEQAQAGFETGEEPGSAPPGGHFLTTVSPADLFAAPSEGERAQGGLGRHLARRDGGKTLLPELVAEGEEDDRQSKLQMLDLPLDLFLALCPEKNDLLFLAHLRCVDGADKVPLRMHADGDFSVVVGNRLPPKGANVTFLVSLEGWRSLLEEKPKIPTADRVRLVTLLNWTFVNDSGGFDTFGELAARLDCAGFGAVVPDEAEVADETVRRALADGYVPVEYRPQRSDPTLAWYRGPLSPVPAAILDKSGELFHRADAALIYDPTTGLMDVSYAAAWQLGRLLALSSSGIARQLRLFVDDRHDSFDAVRQIADFLETHSSAVAEFWQGEPSEAAADGHSASTGEVPAAAALLDWLARLARLEWVKFDYLVAHPDLLPPESLRFFTIDNNWVEALLDGALSVGFNCARDQDVSETHRGDFHRAISKLVYQYHRHLQYKHRLMSPSEAEKLGAELGADPSSAHSRALSRDAPDTYMEDTKTGFLLRSATVSGWPGTEVKCFDRHDQALDVIRMDHLEPDLLFCFVHGQISKVVLKEPAEGVRFGVEEGGSIMLRRWREEPVGTKLELGGEEMDLKRAAAKHQRRDGLPGVLDIAGLAMDLADAVEAAEARRRREEPDTRRGRSGFMSAAFALQMLVAPKSRSIRWKSGGSE